MAALFTSTWGNPSATKRVLMIHGMTGSSQFWHHIALGFASRGYFVVAPDLLGHGNARRGPDYTMAAIVEELRPLLTTPGGDGHPWDIVIGHSLGGVVAAALLPLLKSTQPVRVIIGDPPLEITPETTALYKKAFCHNIQNPREPEGYLKEYPSWTKEDAIFRSLSFHLCDLAAVEAIFDQNDPWSFSHLLSSVPDNVKVTVLAADPSMQPCIREEDLKPYPHVTAKTVWGGSHRFPLERPLVFIETALEGVKVD